MGSLFIIGSFWFWSLLLLTFSLCTWHVNRKDRNGVFPTIFIALSIGLFFWLGNSDLFNSLIEFIKIHPVKLILYVLSYLAIGALWSMVKWYYFLVDCKKDYIEELEYNKRMKYQTPTLNIPTAKKHSGDIILWMSYWVFSMFWTLCNQWIKRIWINIFNRLEGVYNKIANSMFKDITKEISDINAAKNKSNE